MRILFVMHTDWDWIKQRSQFISEKMRVLDGSTIHIVYKKSLRRQQLIKSQKPANCRGMFLLPFKLRVSSVLNAIDNYLFSAIFKIMHFIYDYDSVVFTHPLLYNYIAWHNCAIYDLHDDNEKFYAEGTFLNRYIHDANAAAIKGAKGLVFSSSYLYNKYCNNKSSVVVRNGHDLGPFKYNCSTYSNLEANIKKIYYFGTISEWFNFEYIKKAVLCIPNIEFHIIGPSDIDLPEIERTYFYGPMQHDVMIEKCMHADGFIMPFIINDLIEGVDPVKLYEYIWFGKPTIIPFYDEVTHFSDYVDFYSNESEFIELIRLLCENKIKLNTLNRADFLAGSSWMARANSFYQFTSLVAKS